MEWLASCGAHIYLPVGHSPDTDLIADLGGRLVRVEVKTSTSKDRDRWNVMIATRGGNQSWNGLVKYFDPSRCDYLFVHVGNGRRWFIPTQALEARSAMTLGGPKYSEFEVEPGRPLIEEAALKSKTVPGECPSGQRELTVNEPAQPTQVRILPPPSNAPGSPRVGPRKAPALPPLDVGRTVIWTKRRMTIPRAPFDAAALEVGDTLRVRADGPGRLSFERIDRP